MKKKQSRKEKKKQSREEENRVLCFVLFLFIRNMSRKGLDIGDWKQRKL